MQGGADARGARRWTRRHILLMLGAATALPLAAACQQPASTSAPKTDAKPAAPAKPAEAAKPAATTAPAAPAAQAQPTAAKPAEAKPAAQAPAAPASGTLIFWLYKTRLDPFDKYRTDRIQAWGKQANVPLEVVEIGTSDYGKRIPAAIESKTLPDVLEAGDE
jgi:ABC-type glycerol-3-phosphate transport system substrate-binding protein